MTFRYSRVSRGNNQKNDLQLNAFKKADVEKVLEENASNGHWDRPELNDLIDQLRKNYIVAMWKLGRLLCSIKGNIILLECISEKGAYFKSLTENIDTTNAAGTMIMHDLSLCTI